MDTNIKGSSKNEHQAVRKCMKHLEVIGADDKTRQIVYMYMKTLDDELLKLKSENT